MFTKLAVMVCLAALFMSGCGGISAEEATHEELGTAEQSIIWDCNGTRAWNRYWYKNGVETGREYCDCPGVLTTYGTPSGTYTQQFLYYCQ